MKLNLNKKGQAGLTLIEVTLVIAVLLGLISVLFIGVAAYKAGSDRAKCIVNISTVQKAVRSVQNLYELDFNEAFTEADLIDAEMIQPDMDCPGDGTYTFAAVIPPLGTAYLTCTDHEPKDGTAGW